MTSTDTLTTRYLDLPGGRLAYDDTPGAGTPVVLLPGMLDTRRAHRYLRPLLAAAGHRVITMDLRGFGESSIEWDDYSPAAAARDVIALLDHLGIERAALIGHSYTCATAVKVAGDHPERVSGITLLAPFIGDAPAGVFRRGLMGVLSQVLLNVPSFWGMYLKMAFPTAKPADFEEYRAGLVAALRTPGRRVATNGQLHGDAAPEGWTEHVRCPALVVMGSKDPDFPNPAATAERQADALRARKVMIDGAGHYPMAEFPQATADALLPFLRDLREVA